MEALNSVAGSLKSLMKSCQDLVTGNRHNKSSNNPIEILKRLQREVFSDLMKLRDRQDKVEKLLTFYRTSKGTPFEDGGTRVRGEVGATGTLFLMDNLNQEKGEAIERAGLRTGINARIIFETKVRDTNILEAEFICNPGDSSDALQGALSLSRVSYGANMTDWLSVVAVPMGAQCKDVAISTDFSSQERGLTDYSSSGPPLLRQNLGTALGLTMKKSNITASFSRLAGNLPGSIGQCLSTFAHIVYQLPPASKLSLFGLNQVTKYGQQAIPGVITIPLSLWKRHQRPETSIQTTSPPFEAGSEGIIRSSSVALMLESELDESTRIRGWVQMRNSDPSHLKWSVSMSDFPEDQIGWGLSLGGAIQGKKSWDYFQVEAFLRFSLGKRLSFQPAFVYLMDGKNQMPALTFHSTWSL